MNIMKKQNSAQSSPDIVAVGNTFITWRNIVPLLAFGRELLNWQPHSSVGRRYMLEIENDLQYKEWSNK